MSGPLPVFVPASVALPVGLAPQLALLLAEYDSLCRRGRRPPGAPGRIVPDLQPFVDAVNAASAAYAGRPRHVSVTRITTSQAAVMLHTSRAMVRRWLRERRLDGVKAGRDWLVDLASIDGRLAHGGRSISER